MKLVKSLLLGTAAGLVTVAGAQAADLPVRKAAAVEYVQLCPAFGRGFFTIPGTETCIQLSGFARGELIVAEQDNDAQDALGWRARMRLNFDVRTATAFGPVRAYIRLDTNRSYGAFFTGGTTGFGTLSTPGGLGGGGATAQGLIVDQAYVQYGGFVAGRNTSIFSPGPGGDRYFGARFDDGPNNEQFSYVFDAGAFAQGLEIAVGIENPFNRRTNNNFAANAVGVFAPGAFAFGPNSGALAYGGQELPDFVGRVTYKGTWGYAYVAGAVHQVNDVGVNTVPAAVGPGGFAPVIVGGVRQAADDEIGFAVNGSVEVNLPMLSAGSLAWVWAGYADGAVSYVGYGIGGPGGEGGIRGAAFGTGIGGAGFSDLPITDAVVIGGDIRTTEAFSVAAGFRYTFSPQFRANIYGSYSMVDFAGGASSVITAGAFAGARTGFVDFEEAIIAGNLIYTPVAGLDIGVEVLYRETDPRGSVVRTRAVAGGGAVQDISGRDDTIAGRFRVNRSF